jgi:hypothetical protein
VERQKILQYIGCKNRLFFVGKSKRSKDVKLTLRVKRSRPTQSQFEVPERSSNERLPIRPHPVG